MYCGKGDDESELNHEFLRVNNEPMYWQNKSQDLFASARVLWVGMKADKFSEIRKKLEFHESFDFSCACFPVYMMVCGLALELSIKSYLVAKREEIPKNHQLQHLVQILGIACSREEIGIFNIYAEYIHWAGRYPTPNNIKFFGKLGSLTKEFAMENISENEEFKIYRNKGAFAWDQFSSLYSKINSEFWRVYKGSYPHFEPE